MPLTMYGYLVFDWCGCPIQALFQVFGFAYQGKVIMFRFIIEYSSLREFGP
jgi:hypothetical protein